MRKIEYLTEDEFSKFFEVPKKKNNYNICKYFLIMNEKNGFQYIETIRYISNVFGIIFATIIYVENKLEVQINQRISDYFLNYIRIDYEKNIHYHELLINYYPNFMNKDLKKFQPYIIPTIYNFIKDKKYKNAIQKNMEWKLNFEKFFDK
jgi:hypothetical protein